jgi:hypothetical protein
MPKLAVRRSTALVAVDHNWDKHVQLCIILVVLVLEHVRTDPFFRKLIGILPENWMDVFF